MTDNTDKKIIKAFNDLVIKYGYKGTTTRKIAEEAGINESTVFRHYSTKRDILEEILQRGKSDMKEIIADIQITDNTEDDIVTMGNIYLQFIQQHQVTFLMAIRESYQYPDIHSSFQTLNETMIQLLTNRFIQSYKDLDPAEITTQLRTLFVSLFGFAVLKVTYPDSSLVTSDQQFLEKSFRPLVRIYSPAKNK